MVQRLVFGEKKARVLRGGSWTTKDPMKIRSDFRLDGPPGERDNNNGFRVVLLAQE
jgi:formylglycine-generating enzyme required for sulfatase activity